MHFRNNISIDPDSLSRELLFKGSVQDEFDLPKNVEPGTLMFIESTQHVYAFSGTDWIMIADEPELATPEPEIEYVVTVRECPSCGAPVNRNHRHCKYCDMPYPLEEKKRRFS